MPKENAIVALVVGIEPPLVEPAAELLGKQPEGISIEFEGKQTALVVPGDRAAGMLQILDELRKMEMPAYVEVDPESKAITRLLIPLVVRVAEIGEAEEGDVSVALEISHAQHLLKRDNPDFGELLEALRAAEKENAWLIVAESDAHEIIDVRPSPRPAGPPAPGEAELPKAVPGGLFGWVRDWFCKLFRCWCCLTLKQAQQLFDTMAATSCDPLTVPAPCIPFLYPEDGCWARAHEMCRLMIAAGARPKKVWIYHSPGNVLHVDTANSPNCYVNWGWHVAPTLCVRKFWWFFCRSREVVIDPSLFDGPVSKAVWKNIQNDPGAQLVDSTAAVYYRTSGGSVTYDNDYSQTNYYLSVYRLQLQNRALNFGPPPYPCP
jgi:hypothetical protein